MQLKRLFIVRHGETDYNVEGRWQGVMETPLNARGRQQAALLAEHLASEPIGAIYSSPLARAFDTAQTVGYRLDVPVLRDERLRELELGIFQGMTSDELTVRHPDDFSQWRTGAMDYIVPGGESRQMTQDRAYAAFLDICDQTQAESALIVSHGGTLRLLLTKLFGPDQYLSGPMPNTAITTLERWHDQWQIASLAHTAHLNKLEA